MRGFVAVSADGKRFVQNQNPFYFSGANCYYLLVSAHSAELDTQLNLTRTF